MRTAFPQLPSLAFLVAVQVAAPAGLTGGGEGAGPGAGRRGLRRLSPKDPPRPWERPLAGDAARLDPARRRRRGPGQATRWSRGDIPA